MAQLIEKLSHFFAVNRPLSQLLLVSILLFGAVAFAVMPKQYNPEIVRPAFVVHFSYAGADAETARDRVGYELTEALRTVVGIDDINTTIRDGATIESTIIFSVGHNPVAAKSDLLTELESLRQQSGGAISNINVAEVNPETIPVLQAVFSSEGKTIDEVREAVLALQPKVLAVPGVSEVTVVGGEGRVVDVVVDPVALAASNVSLSTLEGVLRGSSLRVVTAGNQGETYVVSTEYTGSVQSTEEIGLLALSPTVRVRDVATVHAGLTPDRPYTLHATKDGVVGEVVMLAVAKQKGTSAPVVTEAVRSALAETLTDSFDQDFSYVVVSDDGVVANDEIMGLTKNLLTSIAIVALILLLFLSTRAALVVLITIPLTFLTVIGIGWLFGETINRITLFALILSLGLLVDASIVVVDTMYDALRLAHKQGRLENLPAIAAAAVKEVGVGLVLSAITSVIVFLPMNYITGMMGPYMEPIAFFVPLALIVSLIIAIVLTPFIAITVLKAEEKETRLSRYFKSILTRITNHYIEVLEVIAYKASVRKTVLLGAVGAFLVTLIFPLSGLVHFQMLPKADRDQIYAYVDLPKGTALTVTETFSETVATVLLDDSQIVSTQLFVGGAPIVDFNGLFKGSPNRRLPEQATLRVNLTKTDTRDVSSTEITTALREKLVAKLGETAQYVRLMEEPPGPPVLATLVAKLSSDDTAVRQTAAQAFLGYVASVDGVVDTYTSVEAPVEQVVYTLDREKLMALGLSPEEVTNWFALTTSPKLVGEMVSAKAREPVPITLSLPFTYTSTPGAAGSVIVAGKEEAATLAGLASIAYVPKESALYLEQALPVDYVTAEVEGRSIVYVVIDIIRGSIAGKWEGYTVQDWGLFGMTLEDQYGSSLELSWGGEWEMTLENFRDLGVAMVVALFLVYAVLVAQYRSFAIPGFILVTVPLGLVGIFTGFLFLDSLFGIYLTATALIGFIALIGIVVNNAIIYLEYVEQSLEEGVTYTEALIAAGAMRLRPILLTSLTTVLGSLTIASDPVWSGLAWAIIFGLSLSTILTLVIFPALLMTFSSQAKT